MANEPPPSAVQRATTDTSLAELSFERNVGTMCLLGVVREPAPQSTGIPVVNPRWVGGTLMLGESILRRQREVKNSRTDAERFSHLGRASAKMAMQREIRSCERRGWDSNPRAALRRPTVLERLAAALASVRSLGSWLGRTAACTGRPPDAKRSHLLVGGTRVVSPVLHWVGEDAVVVRRAGGRVDNVVGSVGHGSDRPLALLEDCAGGLRLKSAERVLELAGGSNPDVVLGRDLPWADLPFIAVHVLPGREERADVLG